MLTSIPGPTSETLGYLAELVNGSEDPNKRVNFHFNPQKITMQQSTGSGSGGSGSGQTASTGQGPWASAGSSPRGRTPSGGSNQSKPPSSPSNANQAVGPVQLLITGLFFDGGYETSVLKECLQLFDWFKPSSNGQSGSQTPPRPTLVLKIGSTTWLKGQITNLVMDFLVVRPDGIPTRAQVTTLQMQGQDTDLPRQNPTSGALASYSSVVLGAGDSLESIAYQTYGHPRLWRQLALVNGIDDPLRVRPGTAVMLPTLNEIVKVG